MSQPGFAGFCKDKRLIEFGPRDLVVWIKMEGTGMKLFYMINFYGFMNFSTSAVLLLSWSYFYSLSFLV